MKKDITFQKEVIDLVNDICYSITLKNFHDSYTSMLCDVIISNGNSVSDFVACDSRVIFYDKEKFCLVELSGVFESEEIFAILVPDEYYSKLVLIKDSLISCCSPFSYKDYFEMDPYIL